MDALKQGRGTSGVEAPALSMTRHFIERLMLRFPGADASPSAVVGYLQSSSFLPARGGTKAYYALCRIGELPAVVVVRVLGEAWTLVTVFRPGDGWSRRHARSLAMPARVLLALHRGRGALAG